MSTAFTDLYTIVPTCRAILDIIMQIHTLRDNIKRYTLNMKCAMPSFQYLMSKVKYNSKLQNYYIFRNPQTIFTKYLKKK